MQIIGVGTEIVECVRIRRLIQSHGELFLARVYGDAEIRSCQAKKNSTEQFAALWAAKEAVRRSLGAQAASRSWTDIEIRAEPSGRYRVVLHGSMRDLALSLQVVEIHLAMAQCRSFATAYAAAVSREATAAS